MPDFGEDIILRIALSGQDEVIEQLGRVGEEGASTFEHLASSFGTIGEIAGGLATAFVGAGTGLLAWAHNVSEATNRVSDLSRQSGFTIEELSGLQSALSGFGASTDSIGFAFRRMAFTIEAVWQQVIADTKRSVNEIINAQNAVKSAQLSVQGSQLGAQNAQLALLDAQEKHRQAYAKLGLSDGYAPSSAELRRRAQEHADLELEQAELAVAQAEQQAAEAAQKAKEAEEALIEARRNNIKTLQEQVGAIIKGSESFHEANKTANLTIENVIKGLVANAGPGADAIRNFKGGILDLIDQAPKVKELFFELSDFMKNSGDETLNSALVMRFFGRGVTQDLVEAMKNGRGALESYIAKLRELHLVLTEENHHDADEFAKSFNRLSNELKITFQQIGLEFAPAFTDGFDKVRAVLERNHDAIIARVKEIAEQIRPVIAGVFDVITTGRTNIPWLQALHDGLIEIARLAKDVVGPAIVGFFAALGNTKLDPGSSAEAWKQTFLSLGQVISTVVGAITRGVREIEAAFADVKQQLKSVFGEEFANALGVAFIGALILGITSKGGISTALTTIFGVGLAKQIGQPFGDHLASAIVLGITGALSKSAVGKLILLALGAAEGLFALAEHAQKPVTESDQKLKQLDAGIERKHKAGELSDEEYAAAKQQSSALKKELMDSIQMAALTGGVPGPVPGLDKQIDDLAKKFHIDVSAKPLDENTKASDQNTAALERNTAALSKQESGGRGATSAEQAETPPPKTYTVSEHPNPPGPGEVDITRGTSTSRVRVKEFGPEAAPKTTETEAPSSTPEGPIRRRLGNQYDPRSAMVIDAEASSQYFNRLLTAGKNAYHVQFPPKPGQTASEALGDNFSAGKQKSNREFITGEPDVSFDALVKAAKAAGIELPSINPAPEDIEATQAKFRHIRDELQRRGREQFEQYFKQGARGPYRGQEYGVYGGRGEAPDAGTAVGQERYRRAMVPDNAGYTQGQRTSPVDYLMEQNPGMTRRQAQQEYARQRREYEADERRLEEQKRPKPRIYRNPLFTDAFEPDTEGFKQFADQFPTEGADEAGFEDYNKQLSEENRKALYARKFPSEPGDEKGLNNYVSGFEQQDREAAAAQQRAREEQFNQKLDQLLRPYVSATKLFTPGLPTGGGAPLDASGAGPSGDVLGAHALNEAVDNLVSSVKSKFSQLGEALSHPLIHDSAEVLGTKVLDGAVDELIDSVKSKFSQLSEALSHPLIHDSAEVIGAKALDGAIDALVSSVRTKFSQLSAALSQPLVHDSAEVLGAQQLNSAVDAVVDGVKQSWQQLTQTTSQPVTISAEVVGAEKLNSAFDALVDAARDAWSRMAAELSKPLPTPSVGAGSAGASSAAGSSPAGGDAEAPEGRAFGGPIRGPGGPRGDKIPIMASDGEYVLQAPAVSHYGLAWVHALNNMSLPKFADGGFIGTSRLEHISAPSVSPAMYRDVHSGSAHSPAPALHPVTITMPNGKPVSGFYARPDAVDEVKKAALDNWVNSAGNKPSWYSGR